VIHRALPYARRSSHRGYVEPLTFQKRVWSWSVLWPPSPFKHGSKFDVGSRALSARCKSYTVETINNRFSVRICVCSTPISDQCKNAVRMRVCIQSTCSMLLRFLVSVCSVSLLVSSAEKSLSVAKSYLHVVYKKCQPINQMKRSLRFVLGSMK
jgi:hypothetical protein